MPAFTDRTKLELTLLSNMGVPPASILDPNANPTTPSFHWVSNFGDDGGGGNGQFSRPYKTIKRAIRESKDGRGDYIFPAPGNYAESIDIGAGDTSFGSNSSNGYQKRNLHIIGCPQGGHNGVVQIIGDGATAAPTLKVEGGFATGFLLKNVELDTNLLAQPALEIITNDNAPTPAASAAHYRFAVEDVAVRSRRPAYGVLLTGATLGTLKRLTINGPNIGIGFTGSTNNFPSDLLMEDLDFFNGFSTTQVACFACVSNDTSMPGVIAAAALTNILVKRPVFADPTTGAGGGTNYINLPSTSTCLNVGFWDCNFATAPTNGTNKVATLPTNVIVTGWGQSTTRIALKG